jgi:uncharacterized phage-like protein YoqJ
MKTLISGHRLFKLQNYSIDFIKYAIDDTIDSIATEYGNFIGYSGMASGVDLWFCDSCLIKKYQYNACIPFKEQEDEMDADEKMHRQTLIDKAANVYNIRNSAMIDKVDMAIIVWDGNKGGTHNVLQQCVEVNKKFYWVNPVRQNIIKCY